MVVAGDRLRKNTTHEKPRSIRCYNERVIKVRQFQSRRLLKCELQGVKRFLLISPSSVECLVWLTLEDDAKVVQHCR